jgi:hypothetical protein
LVHPFQKVFEIIEPARPEAGHLLRPVDQWGQGADLCAEKRLAALVAIAHQPGLFQHAKMFRDGWLRNTRMKGQSPNALFAPPAQLFEEGSPGRIGERLEEDLMAIWHSIHNSTAIDQVDNSPVMRLSIAG